MVALSVRKFPFLEVSPGVNSHRLRHPLRVTGGNLVENPMMLAIGKLHFASLRQAKAPKEVEFPFGLKAV
jgi:hypothetical protein